MNNDVFLVKSISEITQHNVRYAHVNSPSKWILIDKDQDGVFSVYGFLDFKQPSFVMDNKYYVKGWKTFDSVIAYLNLCSSDGRWGLKRFN